MRVWLCGRAWPDPPHALAKPRLLFVNLYAGAWAASAHAAQANKKGSWLHVWGRSYRAYLAAQARVRRA
jgi:hypothetical protein